MREDIDGRNVLALVELGLRGRPPLAVREKLRQKFGICQPWHNGEPFGEEHMVHDHDEGLAHVRVISAESIPREVVEGERGVHKILDALSKKWQT